MSSIKDPNIEALLIKIENNAKEFEKVPVELIDEDFIIQAIQRNTMITRFIPEEYLKNDRVAFTIALTVESHKNIIKEKLNEHEFYLNYICQKIKNKDIDDSETYKNKEFLSQKENVMKVLEKGGEFKLSYLPDNLRDSEDIVDIFCNIKKVNQIWASERIKNEAAVSGVEVSEYVKKKLFYQKLDAKFATKKEVKGTKI